MLATLGSQMHWFFGGIVIEVKKHDTDRCSHVKAEQCACTCFAFTLLLEYYMQFLAEPLRSHILKQWDNWAQKWRILIDLLLSTITILARFLRGGGVLPYISHITSYRYVPPLRVRFFCAVLVWKEVWFSRELRERKNVFIVSIPNE